MRGNRSRFASIVAIGAVSALLLAGCSGKNGGNTETPAAGDSPATDEAVTLTVTTFGTMGLEGLYDEYMQLHPNVTIEATNIDTGGNARTDAFTKIAAGSGLADVVALEEGWLGAIMEVSDTFVDLTDYGIADRAAEWLDWKYAQGTDPSGRVIGAGTDIGPEGICYRQDLFAAAGLPSDRTEVATLLDGDWDNFFEVGRQYQQATGKAWFDQSGFVWNAMVNQLPEGYYTKAGELNIEGNTEMRARWDSLAAASADGLSAAQTAWDWNGGQSFVDGTFATFVCPGWMLGVVKGQIEAGGGDATTGWDFADVFPGGAANWGGSFLAVPETSENKEAAAALVLWLTESDQQVKQFEAAGNFPSTVAAAAQLAESATPDPIFNGAPVGAILAGRAEGVTAQFKGPDDSLIQENVFGVATQALDTGTANGEQAWNQAIQLLNDLVVNG